MRGMNLLPLDDDIIDRIFIFLPDYPTLHATILSSKSFHNIFILHPNSIIRAVSYNIVGPALAQAIRLLRYSVPQADSQPVTLGAPSSTWSEDDPISPISHEECRQLAENAQVVNALEDLFSRRHKDRSFSHSVLNSMESWRFRRAVYRLMLLAKILPVNDDSDEEDEDEDEDEDSISETQDVIEARRKRQQFLSEFSNYDLHQLQSAASFLVDVAAWVTIAQGNGPNETPYYQGLVIARGPTLVLQAYRTVSDAALWPGVQFPYTGYLSQPLLNIWEERKTKPPPDDNTHWSSIIDDVVGDQDTCSKCNGVHGLDLWNETNWEYLRGFTASLTLSFLWTHAKGSLGSNVVDHPEARSRFFAPTFTYTKLFHEIYQVKSAEYSSWDKQDWLCAACITELLRSHLHLWLLERKRESGAQIQEDCWYGYNCRTQTHSQHHAARLNHLCEPSR